MTRNLLQSHPIYWFPVKKIQTRLYRGVKFGDKVFILKKNLATSFIKVFRKFGFVRALLVPLTEKTGRDAAMTESCELECAQCAVQEFCTVCLDSALAQHIYPRYRFWLVKLALKAYRV